MKRTLCFFLTVFLLGIGMATAQTRTVTGTVTSEADGQPVVGASVLVKGYNLGAATDIDGKFSIANVPANARTLVISYIGMQTREVAIANVVNVALKSTDQTLDDVVVVAYGTAKKQSLVGAQANVNAKDIEKRPLTNITSALSATAPGIQSITATGQPGSSTSIMVRGFGSINASSAPLYVVDGAIFNGSLSDIAPSDVQSVSILKDAAATSLYGSSAGNGVVLITTKSGAAAKNGRPSITLTINQGFTRKGMPDYKTVDAMQYYPLVWRMHYNDYVMDPIYVTNYGLTKEDMAYYANVDAQNNLKYQPFAGIKTYITNGTNYGLATTQDAANSSGPLIVMPDGTLNPEITGLLWGDDMNWKDALFRTGYRQEYSLSGSYANDRIESFYSLSYLNEDGYRKGTSFERFSGRANITYNVTNWLRMGTNVSFAKKHNEAPKRAEGSYSANSFNFYRGIAPIYPIHVHNADGSYVLGSNGEKVYDHNADRPYLGRFNPVEEALLDKSYYDADALNTRSFLEFDIYKGLKFRTNLSYDLYRAITKTRYNNQMGDQPQGLLIIKDGRMTSITFNQLLTYNHSFGDHNFDFLLGHENYNYKNFTSEMDKDGMTVLGLDEMPNLVNMTDIRSGTTPYRKEGYFARVNYDYKGLYNASLSYRRDGSSRFSPENRWGNFWSVGAGWLISNEKWFKAKWVDFLKLRASIGQTGNDAVSSYFTYMTLYGFGNNNNDQAGVRFDALGTPELKWETQVSGDLALEFGLFNKLHGTVEFFNKESKDLLFSFPLAVSTGIGSMNKNLGKVRNYGVEFDLTYNIMKTRDFNWDFNVNGTFLKNKIVRLPEDNRVNGIETGNYKYLEGKSIYDFYLPEYIGVDPDTGMAIYRLDTESYPGVPGMAEEGEKATWTTNYTYVKKHYAGSSIPKLYGGFGTSASYKGVDFALLFGYQLGGKAYDGGYQSLMERPHNNGKALHVDALKAWQTPGDVTDVPAYYSSTMGQYATSTSDRWLVSSDGLMLKSLTLGYTLPRTWVRSLSLSDVRVSVAGENLFLLSARKGLNPFNSFGGATGAAYYDFARTYTLSLTVKF